MLALLFPPSLGHIAASARADLLTRWFSRYVSVEVDVQVARSYDGLRRAIEGGTVDLAWAPPTVCAAVQPSCLAILKAVRGGRSMYRGALVTRRGEARTLTEMQGYHAAWVDRLSSAGYLLPMGLLRDAGHDPDLLLGTQDFVGSYGRALRALLDHDVDVAPIYVRDASAAAVRNTLVELVGASDRLQTVEYTAEAPSDGLVVVDREQQENIHQVLEQLRALTTGRQNTMLLTILDAEALETADADDYAALRRAVLD